VSIPSSTRLPRWAFFSPQSSSPALLGLVPLYFSRYSERGHKIETCSSPTYCHWCELCALKQKPGVFLVEQTKTFKSKFPTAGKVGFCSIKENCRWCALFLPSENALRVRVCCERGPPCYRDWRMIIIFSTLKFEEGCEGEIVCQKKRPSYLL
jgi:hypothetical protein